MTQGLPSMYTIVVLGTCLAHHCVLLAVPHHHCSSYLCNAYNIWRMQSSVNMYWALHDLNAPSSVEISVSGYKVWVGLVHALVAQTGNSRVHHIAVLAATHAQLTYKGGVFVQHCVSQITSIIVTS
jgi:hypothetical protein